MPIEVKLGAAQIENATRTLVKLKEKMVHAGASEPAALCVVVGFGVISHTTKEGVFIVPVDYLGP